MMEFLAWFGPKFWDLFPTAFIGVAIGYYIGKRDAKREIKAG